MPNPRPHKTDRFGALLGAVLLLLPPVFILADTMVAVYGGWRPNGKLQVGILMLACLWSAGVLLLLTYPRNRRLMYEVWPGLLLLLVSGVLAWAALEAGAAWTAHRLATEAAFHTRGPNLQRLFEPEPAHITGIEGASRYTTGERGIRAPFPPGPQQETQVVCVGGSTTECTYLDDFETWPALLMRRLNPPASARHIWVGNVGISGYATPEHIRFVCRSPLLDNVDAVVLQPGINDLWRFLADEEDEMAYGRFQPEQTPPPALDAHPNATRPLWTRSRVIQLYHDLRRLRARELHAIPAALEQTAGAEYATRRVRRAEARICDDLPNLAPGLRRYRERLNRLIDCAEDRGIVPVFITQPVLWDSGLSSDTATRCWFGWLPDGRYLSLAMLRRGMDLYNETLREVCAARGMPCVDLAFMNGDPAYFYDDCHVTETGAEVIAERITPVLSEILE
ncbi:MAG: SGNH/GDSL hydrolase family protein [Candidatus Hydrogenedentota bacterium]